jgi:hypothetical protein
MRPDVVRDVLARLAVAAGARLDEVPVLVDDLDARPVELRLDAEARRLGVGEPVADAPVELGELLLRVRVVERDHAHACFTCATFVAPRRPRAGWASSASRAPGAPLERAQLAQERVELGVADLGSSST